jgi:hypothetical protein
MSDRISGRQDVLRVREETCHRGGLGAASIAQRSCRVCHAGIAGICDGSAGSRAITHRSGGGAVSPRQGAVDRGQGRRGLRGVRRQPGARPDPGDHAQSGQLPRAQRPAGDRASAVRGGRAPDQRGDRQGVAPHARDCDRPSRQAGAACIDAAHRGAGRRPGRRPRGAARRRARRSGELEPGGGDRRRDARRVGARAGPRIVVGHRRRRARARRRDHRGPRAARAADRRGRGRARRAGGRAADGDAARSVDGAAQGRARRCGRQRSRARRGQRARRIRAGAPERRARAVLANIGFGIAAGTAVTAVVLWFTGAPESPRVALAPALSPGQLVVTATRSW